MKRLDLLNKLECVEPALSTNDLVPVLGHFCFTGDTLFAYNDRIGLSTPLITDFQGAVPGKLLLGLLKASKAESLDIEADDKEIALRVPKSKSVYRLAMLPPKSFVFEMPKLKRNGPCTMDFCEAIKVCLSAVGSDTSVPEHMGVTLIPDKSGCSFYSTDDATMAHVYVKANIADSRVIVPTRWCKQLLDLTKLKDNTVTGMEITTDYALLVTKEATLFGRILQSKNPIDFHEHFDQHVTPEADKQLVPMPSKLELILERAAILASIEDVPTKIEVHAGEMSFFTANKRDPGEVYDTMQVKDHPSVSASLDAKLLKVGFEQFGVDGDMLITERCAIMSKGSAYYLVACRG